MPIGFEGAVGNEGLFATIRQQIADRMAQQAQTHAMSVEDQKLQIEKDRFAQEAQDRALLRQQQSTALNETLGEKSATSLGAGQTVLSPTDPTAVAIMNSSQRSNMHVDASLPSTQLARGVPLVSGQTGMSPELAARFQNTTLAPLVKTETPEATQSPEATAPTVTEKPSVLTGNLRFMGTPAANAAENTRVLRGQLLATPSLTPQQRLEMQAESAGLKAPTREPKPTSEPLESVMVGGKPVLTPRSQAAGMTPFVKPSTESTVTIQTVDPTTGAPTTRVLTKADALKQGSFAGKQDATTSNRLVSAKAVVQTGEDIKNEVQKNAAILGPVLSRYDNVADFVGAPPPEFARLAGLIESYSLANMGVHGMRSNGGAQDIKSTIGLGRHTPESLLTTIDGLNGFANHLLQNEGRSAGTAGSTPVGPPAPATSKVRKYNPATGKLE